MRPRAGARAALRGLTTRGRLLLGVGLGLLLAGFAVASTDLLRVGALLVLLPLIAVVVVARTRYRVSCTRTLEPPRAAAGDVARATLRLENISWLPTGVLLAEDEVPAALGGRPRFTLDRVEAGGVRSASYQITAAARGRYRLGPLTVRLTDPFGLVELPRAFASTDELVITPVVTPLPAVRLGGEWTGGGEARAHALASSGSDDVATRAYRRGDDLRRVHWRSTARVGELMVRREEQPWQSRAALLLDTRASAHRGDGAASSFEAAVAALASIGAHLARRGFALRTLDTAGRESGSASPVVAEGLLMEGLATVSPSRGGSLQAGLSRLDGGARESLLVAVCGLLHEPEAAALARARGSGVGIAVLLDVPSWSGPALRPGETPRPPGSTPVAAGVAAAAEVLAVAGWRAVVLRRGDALPPLWERIALGDPRAGRPLGDLPAARRVVAARGSAPATAGAR